MLQICDDVFGGILTIEKWLSKSVRVRSQVLVTLVNKSGDLFLGLIEMKDCGEFECIIARSSVGVILELLRGRITIKTALIAFCEVYDVHIHHYTPPCITRCDGMTIDRIDHDKLTVKNDKILDPCDLSEELEFYSKKSNNQFMNSVIDGVV